MRILVALMPLVLMNGTRRLRSRLHGTAVTITGDGMHQLLWWFRQLHHFSQAMPGALVRRVACQSTTSLEQWVLVAEQVQARFRSLHICQAARSS